MREPVRALHAASASRAASGADMAKAGSKLGAQQHTDGCGRAAAGNARRYLQSLPCVEPTAADARGDAKPPASPIQIDLPLLQFLIYFCKQILVLLRCLYSVGVGDAISDITLNPSFETYKLRL